jgi:chemotaxis protein methyltransferase CheR
MAALGLKNPDDYYVLLRYDPRGPEELGRLFDIVTNKETSFFRSPQQFEFFQERILPSCLEARRGLGPVRILSAGCSTGEEPYSLAITLRERPGADLAGKVSRIVALDLSPRALDTARAGLYPELSMRPVPEALRTKYFQPTKEGSWALDPRIRAMVDFQVFNLLEASSQTLPRDVDIIFCRNVLLYFEPQAKKKVLGAFYDALREGGYLIVGATESLHGINRAFSMRLRDRAVAYQKGGAS